MATSSTILVRSLLVSMLFGALAFGQTRRPDRSFTNSDSEASELRGVLSTFMQENDALQDQLAELKEKLAIAEATNKQLTESVAAANAEAEIFRKQSGDLKLKLEALGIAAGTGNTAKLEQRLLTAVNDLRHGEDERKKLTEILLGLTESAMNYAKVATTTQPEVRVALEKQLQKASALLGGVDATAVDAVATAATLTEAMVIDLKDELSLVVTNVGSRQGVSLGMPFSVLRGDRVIGNVRVVDVRERIAGAIVQNLNSEKEKIKVGDRLRVAAHQ